MLAENLKWAYVLTGIFCSSLAQISMKRAALFEGQQLVWLSFLIGSSICYLLSFVCYYFALKYFPISKIAPLMTIGVVLIVVLYGMCSGETIGFKNVLGFILGTVSIYFILS